MKLLANSEMPLNGTLKNSISDNNVFVMLETELREKHRKDCDSVTIEERVNM